MERGLRHSELHRPGWLLHVGTAGVENSARRWWCKVPWRKMRAGARFGARLRVFGVDGGGLMVASGAENRGDVPRGADPTMVTPDRTPRSADPTMFTRVHAPRSADPTMVTRDGTPRSADPTPGSSSQASCDAHLGVRLDDPEGCGSVRRRRRIRRGRDRGTQKRTGSSPRPTLKPPTRRIVSGGVAALAEAGGGPRKRATGPGERGELLPDPRLDAGGGVLQEGPGPGAGQPLCEGGEAKSQRQGGGCSDAHQGSSRQARMGSSLVRMDRSPQGRRKGVGRTRALLAARPTQ